MFALRLNPEGSTRRRVLVRSLRRSLCLAHSGGSLCPLCSLWFIFPEPTTLQPGQSTTLPPRPALIATYNMVPRVIFPVFCPPYHGKPSRAVGRRRASRNPGNSGCVPWCASRVVRSETGLFSGWIIPQRIPGDPLFHPSLQIGFPGFPAGFFSFPGQSSRPLITLSDGDSI